MKRYIGTKIINATPMSRRDYNTLRGWELPADENGDDEGYLMERADNGMPNHPDYKGYINWAPKNVFESAYFPVADIDFGGAIVALKQGLKVARTGWNGKGMFVYLVPADRYPAKTPAAKGFFGDDALVPYNAYMAIKNVDGTVSTWMPSVNDCLAVDWTVL
jgi:hypothetical protein